MVLLNIQLCTHLSTIVNTDFHGFNSIDQRCRFLVFVSRCNFFFEKMVLPFNWISPVTLLQTRFFPGRFCSIELNCLVFIFFEMFYILIRGFVSYKSSSYFILILSVYFRNRWHLNSCRGQQESHSLFFGLIIRKV